MLDNDCENNDSTQVPSGLRWESTDPDKSIELAIYSHRADVIVRPLVLSYSTFFASLAQPDQSSHRKDGSAFLIGPCRGQRAAANIERAHIAVIDADCSLVGGKPVKGAPPPLLVHECLVGYGISHCIYTTHSHGSESGNRYRIVIPVELERPLELQAITTYIVELLQKTAGIPLALSRESYTWGQGWYFPRLAYEGSEFYFAQHFGRTPNPADLAKMYDLADNNSRALPPIMLRRFNGDDSPLRMFERVMPIQTILAEHGYKFVSQGAVPNSDGELTTVYRYLYPGSSTGIPGVLVFCSNGHWRCYSHHSNDPLNDGHANDAFDCFKLLNGIADDQSAFQMLVEQIQDDVVDQMNEEYPSVLEGGYKFKFGNKYVNEFGCVEYRFMDMQAFTCAMLNQPGVPELRTSEEGETFITMTDRAEFWKRSRERIVYNGIRYQPVPITEPVERDIVAEGRKYLNTFGTWHIVPEKGKYALLDWHLRNAICGGQEDQYEWLLNWFAHLFQKPHEKPGVAVVLKGGRGVGKSMLFSELAKKLGTHAFVAGNNRLLTGNFNAHLRDKLLLVVEESFWAGNHADRGKLQHLITDSVGSYEKKGVDPESGVSYLRVVLISNEDWVVPAAADERRYFLPTVTDAAKLADVKQGKRGAYFPRLLAELRGGGLEAFAYEMARRELDERLLRTLPMTPELKRQKHLSLDWLDRWFYEALAIGKIRSKNHGSMPWTEAGCAVSFELLKNSLEEAAPGSIRTADHGIVPLFSARLERLFPPHMAAQQRAPDGLRWVFAGITQCRSAFEKSIGFTVAWDAQILLENSISEGGSHAPATATHLTH